MYVAGMSGKDSPGPGGPETAAEVEISTAETPPEHIVTTPPPQVMSPITQVCTRGSTWQQYGCQNRSDFVDGYRMSLCNCPLANQTILANEIIDNFVGE